ncbi:hypothetical protein [Actibacterium sp. 188UL27-1]|uniref:hypothetical protein n=1 Tax=Actibacterium sp. 188UL27-1 TaxID=2786961 RepID=UPI001959A268|nr:hypothetical protein [Actibacterium sp. 188UL27-1]MBM7066304.1 hypothetical protein [Actibacterium sp. 188UL27-1]
MYYSISGIITFGALVGLLLTTDPAMDIVWGLILFASGFFLGAKLWDRDVALEQTAQDDLSDLSAQDRARLDELLADDRKLDAVKPLYRDGERPLVRAKGIVEAREQEPA